MGGKFRRYSVASPEEILYRMYDFIVNSGQTVMRVVTDGATPAIYKQGTGYVASWASSSDCPDESYFTIEPVTANTTRWQLRLKNSAGNTTKAIFANRGTWSNGGAGPGSFSGNQTQEQTISSSVGATSELWCGTNTYTYGSPAVTATYVWFAIRDSASPSNPRLLWTGNYTPLTSGDTTPVVMMTGEPIFTNTADTWGRIAGDSSCDNRAAQTKDHSQSFSTTGHCRAGISDAATAPGATTLCRNYDGEYLGLPVYIYLNTGGYQIGQFGSDLLAMDASKSNYDTNTGGTRVKIGHCWLRYDEAL